MALLTSGCRVQWRSQPDNLVPLCKFHSITIIQFFRNGLFSQSVNCEYLHSGTKSSGWLRYWSCSVWKKLELFDALRPFKVNRTVAKRSVSYYVHIISSSWVLTKQWNTVRFATIRLKWKTAFRGQRGGNHNRRTNIKLIECVEPLERRKFFYFSGQRGIHRVNLLNIQVASSSTTTTTTTEANHFLNGRSLLQKTDELSTHISTHYTDRAVTKALIGGGGGGAYSYIRVLPDEFLLKSTVMTTDFKRNSSGRTRIYEYPPPPPPPPINALVTALYTDIIDRYNWNMVKQEHRRWFNFNCGL